MMYVLMIKTVYRQKYKHHFSKENDECVRDAMNNTSIQLRATNIDKSVL